MDVTLPNGRIIRGVPEGTPKDIIQQKAIQAGLAKAEDFPQVSQYDQVSAEAQRNQSYQQVASEVGPGEAALIGMGRGFATVGRGLGLMEAEDEGSKLAMEALKERRPYSTGAGEIVGEALPFVAPGLGMANIASLPVRIGAGAALGGVEGGVISAGSGQDVVQGTGVGAAIGGAAETLFPVIGRLGRGLYQRVTGNAPKGALLDAMGNPTEEFQQALNAAGVSYDDLVVEARRMVEQQPIGANPEQVARAAMFEGQNVPISAGELTKDFQQQAVENRLLQSSLDPSADPYRQFKLRQSEAIRSGLERDVDMSLIPELSGQSVIGALDGRYKLLRTQKSDLYKEFAEVSKDLNGIPVMVDVEDAIPSQLKFRGLDRASEGKVSAAQSTLMEYGLIEPTPEMIDAGFQPEMLSIANHDDLLQTLKRLGRADTSGATSGYVGPFIDLIEKEVDTVAEGLEAAGVADNVIKPLKEARQTVAQMKTEFNPKSLVGKLIQNHKGSDIPLIEASKVYNTISAKGMSVENVRRVVSSLGKSGEAGEAALKDLQTTTMIDLLDAGFGTKSRQISGVQVFNPIAFRNRIDGIGKDKLAAIFASGQMMKRLNTFEKIATDITADAATVPKGSAAVFADYMNRLGMMVANTKVPGAGVAMEALMKLSEAGGNRRAVQEAINASPDVAKVAGLLEQSAPGLASAFGIAGFAASQQQPEEN